MKKIKDRWKAEDFLQSVEKYLILMYYKNKTDIKDADLAGISITGKSEIIKTPSLYKSVLTNVDLSYSFIDSEAQESIWKSVNLFKAKLDKCPLDESEIKDCNFEQAKIVINADDTVFEDCSFLKAKIGGATYGYEYGGRRTKFYNCDFTDAVFKNVEFRASKFFNCNFIGTKFINCDLRGMKVEGALPKIEQFERMEILPDFLPPWCEQN